MQEIHKITQGSMEGACKAAKISYEQGGTFDLARAINVYYEEGLDKEQAKKQAQGDGKGAASIIERASKAGGGATRRTSTAPHNEGRLTDEAEAGPAAMGLMPTTKVPEWGLGQPPEGGPHFATFKKKHTQFEKYKNQTANRTTVTFKSCILSELRPALEGKCEMPEHVWNDVRSEREVERSMEEAKAKGEVDMTPYLCGWSDAKVIAKLKETLKPPRVEDYEIQFEAKKLRHSGPQSELWGQFETWAADWLALEREAQSQGVQIEKGRMKKLFEGAVRFHPSIERIIKGKAFSSLNQS
jgi:hypothetical protein